MTVFWPTLDTPTTRYTVQPGCGFLDPRYYAAEKAVHPAIDLNAITGANTDLGDPVRADWEGEVTGTMWHGYIGGIIHIEHADGSTSGYWHLRDLHVKKGMIVQPGDFIGQIGRGGKGDNSPMLAHLHYYHLRPGVRLALDYWPSTHYKQREAAEDFVRDHYFDPAERLTALGAARTLAEYQDTRMGGRVLIVRGEQVETVEGKLLQLHQHAASLDTRTVPPRLYLNEVSPTTIPPTPLK